MAPPKDAEIEQCLRRVCNEAASKDESITMKQARARAEEELKLEEGFFKSHAEWKDKSRNIIQDAFEKPTSQETPAASEPPKAHASQASSSEAKSKEKSKPQRSEPVAKMQSTASVSKGSKSSPSEEHVEKDSSDESGRESETSDPEEPAPKKVENPKQVNGVKRKAGNQSDSEEEGSESGSGSSEDEETQTAPQKKKARKDEPASRKAKPSSEEKSDSGDRDREKSNSPDEDAATPARTAAPIPPKAFEAPQGYTEVEDDLLAADGSSVLPNVDGKQIWHISAPSNFSLSTLKELSLDSIRSGQPVAVQDDIEYVWSEDTDLSGAKTTLMIPSGDGYKPTEHKISRSLHLQQKIGLPNLSIRQADQGAGSSAAALPRAPPVSTARPQPEGLRMRYKPPGFGRARPGILGSELETDDDDQVMSDVQRTFQTKFERAGSEETPKKSKKKQKSKEGGSSQSQANGFSNVTKSSQPPIPSGAAETTLSKERKKQKREKKEAKQKAK